MIDILSIGYIIRRGNDWWCGAKDICLSSCGWIMVSSTDQEEVDAVLKNVSNLIFAGEHLLGLHTWGEGHRRKGSILARVCSDEREKDSGLNLVQKRFLSERALEILIFFSSKGGMYFIQCDIVQLEFNGIINMFL